MKTRIFGTPIIFMAALSCIIFVPAKGDDSTTTVITSTTTATGPVVSTTPALETIVYFRTAPQAMLITTLAEHAQDLNNTIEQAHSQGQLSDRQYQAMKGELKRISDQTVGSTITYPVALMLAQDLDFIAQQYGTIINTNTNYVPIITGSRFTISTGQAYQLDDLSRRRADLETTISKDLLEGSLTPSRAGELRAQLASIGNEANFYLADGNFNAKESRHLYDAFDKVAQEIKKSAGKDKE